MSLCYILLGIVFDTREGEGCAFWELGIVFDTREGEGLPFVGFLLPFYCWVSFSIPVKVWAIVGLIKVIASQSNLRGDKNLQIVDFIMVLQDYYL